MNWTMVLSTKASGPKKASDTVRVSKSGKMGQSTKVTGKMIWPTVEED